MDMNTQGIANRHARIIAALGALVDAGDEVLDYLNLALKNGSALLQKCGCTKEEARLLLVEAISLQLSSLDVTQPTSRETLYMALTILGERNFIESPSLSAPIPIYII